MPVVGAAGAVLLDPAAELGQRDEGDAVEAGSEVGGEREQGAGELVEVVVQAPVAGPPMSTCMSQSPKSTQATCRPTLALTRRATSRSASASPLSLG